jgi:hypothetical protein
LVDTVEVRLNVGVDDEIEPLIARCPDCFQRLGCTSLRAESITDLQKIRLEYRLNHQLRRHLHNSIPYRWYA